MQFALKISILILLLPITGLAQAPTANEQAGILVFPEIPEPQQTATVQLDAYSFNLNAASIDWFVDGELLPEFSNQLEITHQFGDLGETTTLTARLTLADGNQVTISQTVTPARVDIIMEPQTMVGNFYSGAALPSIGSTVRVVAIPQEANYLPPQRYSYRWRLNNDVQFLGQTKGDNVANFILPRGRVVIGVEAFNEAGVLVAKRSIEVPTIEPMLQFYVNNPLRGTSEYPIHNTYQLIENEVNIRAVPFGIALDILDTEHLLEWELNHQVVESVNEDPFEITLRKQTTSGASSLGFHIRNLSQLSQGVKDQINIQF